MVVTIHPKRLAGAVTPPPSKSMAHRFILCAALTKGRSVIHSVALSQDILATLGCIQALGARWEQGAEGALIITGRGGKPCPASLPAFDCGESGSTLRFLIPIALAAAGGGVFTGRGRLMERPLKPYFHLFAEKGIACEQRDGVLTLRGSLPAGDYAIPGNVSSQFLTGLLLALPLAEGESRIMLTTPLESRDYVAMTVDVMTRFGAKVRQEGETFFVSGGGYQSREDTVEADWSQGAFWYAANFLDNPVDIRGLEPASLQGDRAVAAHYWALARPGDAELDVSQCPDLLPPLALMAALRVGTCCLVNAARLRLKESDRLAAVTVTLNALGAQVEEHPDSLTIHGVEALKGNVTLDSCNDHRIAMMAAIAATKCAGPVSLTGAECVNKSYPDFWDHYRMLGGELDVLVSG